MTHPPGCAGRVNLGVGFGLGQPRRGSADRGEGMRITVDDDPRIGLQVENFSVDLEGEPR